MLTFDQFYEQHRSVKPNELKPGDKVRNDNKECKHYKSKGVVTDIKKIKQGDDKIAGNVIVYKVKNSSKKIKGKNGNFHPGEKLAKTESQLEKIREWVEIHDKSNA